MSIQIINGNIFILGITRHSVTRLIDDCHRTLVDLVSQVLHHVWSSPRVCHLGTIINITGKTVSIFYYFNFYFWIHPEDHLTRDQTHFDADDWLQPLNISISSSIYQFLSSVALRHSPELHGVETSASDESTLTIILWFSVEGRNASGW